MKKRKKQKYFLSGLIPTSLAGKFFRDQQRSPDWSTLPQLLTLQQTAELLQIHPNTLRLWDRQGRLSAQRLGSRQDRRYDRQAIYQLWLERRRTPAEDFIRRWASRRQQLHNFRRRWWRPMSVTTAAVALMLVISSSQFVAADTNSPTVVNLPAQNCSGWQQSQQATKITLPDDATLDQFTDKNSAIYDTSFDRVSSNDQGNVAAGSIDALSNTITCGGFSFDEVSPQATLSSPSIVISFASHSQGNSTGSFVLETSTDGKTWTPLSLLPASSDKTGRQIFALDESLSRESLAQLQVRLRPEFGIDTPSAIAWLDGLTVEATATQQPKVTPQKNNQAGRDLNRLVAFSQAAYKSAESPVIKVPKQESKKLLFFTTKQVTWTLNDVTLIDSEQQTSQPKYSTSDSADGADIVSAVNLHTEKLHPGKYTVRVSMSNSDGGQATITKEFLWGVVALDFDRPNPRPNDPVQAGIGVLDDAGVTICNAKIDVKLTDPRGQVTTYNVKKKNLKVNPDCVDKGVTNTPDYSFTFTPQRSGIYHVQLTAKTAAGDRRLEENLMVDAASKFDVQRSEYPTRIYPPSPYNVAIAVTPTQDYRGLVTEIVPADFEISKLTPDGSVILPSTNSTEKKLEWSVDWRAGETYYLRYTFDAPDISPALFLVGPMSIAPNSLADRDWQESRQWQIASDAVTANGNIYYGDTTNAGKLKMTPFTSASTYGTELNINLGPTVNIMHVAAKTAPTREEKMIGFISGNPTTAGRLDIVTGTTGFEAATDYTLRWTATAVSGTQDCDSVPTSGTCTQPFDLGYEALSGRGMVVYAGDSDANSTTDTDVIYYAFWDGSAWSPDSSPNTPSATNQLNLPGTAGTPRWIRVVPAGDNLANERSNRAMVLVADSNDDLFAYYWDGSTFDSGTTLYSTLGNCGVARCFDGNWQGNNVFIVSYTNNGQNEVRYQKYTVGSGWGGDTQAYTTSATPAYIISVADPTSSRILSGNYTTGNDTRSAVWRADDTNDGWTVCASGGCPDTSGEGAGGPQFGLAFERFSGQGLHVYNNAANGTAQGNSYMTYTTPSTWGATSTTGITPTDDQQSTKIIPSPSSDDIMIIAADVDCDVDAVLWDGSAPATPGSNFELLLSSSNGSCANSVPIQGMMTTGGYDFAWNIYSPWGLNWRWTGDTTTATPGTWLANENVTPTGVADGTTVRLRYNFVNRGTTAQALTAEGRKKLQYTTDSPDSLTATWTDVDADNGAGIWRYNDCSAGTDDSAIPSTQLTAPSGGSGTAGDFMEGSGNITMTHNAGPAVAVENDYCIEANGPSGTTTYYFRAYDSEQQTPVFREQDNDGAVDCATAACTYPSLTTAAATITIDGTCDGYDQTTNCADLGDIRVAVGGSLQTQLDANGGGGPGGTDGTFSITSVPKPSANSIITVFVDGAPATASNRAVAITKYDGSGNITGLKLFKEHLTIGSGDTAASLSSAELGSYDNSVASGDDDVFFDYRTDWSSNAMTATGGAITGFQIDCDSPATTCNNFSSQEELYLQSGWTYAPATVVATHDLENAGGTLTVGTNTLTISGSWVNTGTFTKSATQTTNFTSGSAGETIVPGTSSNFANLTFNGSGADWTVTTNPLNVDEALTMTAGQLKGTQNVTVIGDAGGTAGTINLTGGTFEQRVGTSRNFGPTTASTNWTFASLKFTTTAATPTITTQACTTCTKTVTSVLTVGSTSDANILTFNAGNTTWVLSGSGTPLVISLNNGTPTTALRNVWAPGTSTVQYSNAGSVSVADEDYYNLQTTGAGTYTVHTNTDDFERASLGTTNWTVDLGTPAICASHDWCGTATGFNTSFWGGSNNNSAQPDQYSETTITSYQASEDIDQGVRISRAATNDLYEIDNDGSTFFNILQGSGGSFATLLTMGAPYPQVGDKVRLEASGPNNAVRLRAYVNGVLRGEVVDTTTTLNTGEPGIFEWNGGSPTAKMADWSGGGTLVVSNNLTVSSGTLALGTASVLVQGGNISNSGTITQSSNGSTVVEGTGSIGGSGATTFGNLTIGKNDASQTTTAGGNFTVGGVLNIASSSGTNAFDASTRTITLSGSGTPLNIAATETFTASSSTIVYVGAAATTVTRTTYNNLEIKPGANGVTHTIAGGGTLTVGGNLTVGDGTHTTAVVDAETNDPVIDANGNFTISNNTTFNASSTASFTVAGDFTNSAGGIYGEGTGTLTLDGAASKNLNSGCSNTDACTSNNFYRLTINKTDASDANDNVTLTSNGINVADLLTITDGELIQGALNVRAEGAASAVSIASAGKWSNISTGDIKLGGPLANAGVLYLDVQGNSNGCGGGDTDDIALTSTDTNVRTISGAGTFTLYDVTVNYMNDTTTGITDNGGTDGGTNTGNWTFTGCGITITGTIYSNAGAEASTVYNCNADNLTIHASVNGGATTNATCTAIGGTFSITTDTTPSAAEEPIVVWIDSAETPKATTVTMSADTSSGITGLIMIQDRVIATYQGTGPVTNAKLGTADNGNAGIRYSVSSGNLTVETGMEFHVLAGKTFTAGGNITTTATGTASGSAGDVHLPSTAVLDMAGNALSVGGDLTNAGTLTVTGSQTTTMTATGTGFTLTSGGATLRNLVFNGASGGWTNSGALTLAGDFTGTAGGFTQANSTTITINGSAFSLANGFTWARATSGANLILENGTNLDFTDSNTTKQNLGVVQIGASPGVTTLKSDMSATTVTIPTTDTFKTKGWDVTTTGTFDCQGSCVLDLTDTAPNNETDGTILDIGGDFTMSSSATFTSYSNSTLFMNSTSGTDTNRTFTTGGKAYNDVELKNAGGTNDDITISGSPLDVNGVLTLTDGQLRLDTNDPNVTTAGNLSIASAATVTKADNGTATWTFDGSGTSTWTDSTGSGGQDLGLVSINGSSKTINLGSSAKASKLTIATSQTFGLASSGYTFTLTGSGTAGSRPFQNSGILNEGTNSTFAFIGTGTIGIDNETFFNLTLAPSGAGSPTYTLDIGNVGLTTVSGSLVIGDGTNAVTVDNDSSDYGVDVNADVTINASGTYIIGVNGTYTIGGSLTNSGTLTDHNGGLTFDATSSGKNITGNFTGSSALGGIVFSGSGGGWTMASNMTLGGFTLSAGAVTQGANVALTVSGGWSMSSGTTFTKASGTGTIVFDGTSAQTFTDNTASKQNLGDVTITKTNGTPANNKITLASSMTVDTMTISASNTLDLATSGYTLDVANQGATATPLVVTGTLTVNSSSTVKFSATNSGGNITVPIQTYASLDCSPTATETCDVATSLTVSGTLTVGSNGTLAIASSQTLTHSGATLTLNGTISGAGRYTYQSATALPTSGTITSILRMDVTNAASQSITCSGGGRTLGGAVEFYSNAGTAKVITLCGTVSHILNISGAVSVNAANTGGLTIEGNTYDPAVNVTGNFAGGTAGGGTETVSMGSGTWTMSGDVDFTNTTVSNTSGGTMTMNGTGGKTLTGNNQTFNNLTFSPSGTNTINVATSQVNLGGTLTVGANTTLSSTQTINMNTTSCSLNLDSTSTVTGSGSMWYDCNSNSFPTTGTFSLASLWFIAFYGNMTIPARDFTGTALFRLYNNSGTTRTITLGAGTFNISAPINIYSGSGANTTIDASNGGANNPTVNASSDLTFNVTAAETRTLITGTGPWTFGGNVNLTNATTFTPTSGNTIVMNGATKTLTSAGFSLNNFTVSGGSVTMSGTTTLTGNFLLSGGTATAPTTMNVDGNWTNSGGTFTEGTGTVNLTGTTSTTLNSGCATVSTCTNENFYDLTINKTGGVGANDNVTLTSNGIRVTHNLTITAGELVQGALNVQVDTGGSVSVGASGIWTNISTGDLLLGGGFSNAGSVTFSSSNAAQCTDVADDIVIDSTVDNTLRTWSGAGTYTMRNINVDDMSDGAITITIYTSTKSGDTDWTTGACGITVSGTVFGTNESSPIGNPPCDSSTQVIRIRVNGTTQNVTASCAAADSTYTKNISTVSAGDTITVYLDNVTANATTVARYNGSGDITMNLYQDRVAVTSGDATAITNTIMDQWDSGDEADGVDGDIGFTVTTGALTVSNTRELHVVTGKNYTPGGTVTSNATGTQSGAPGDVHITASSTMTMGTNALSVGGDFTNAGTFAKSATQTTTFTATGAGFTITPNGNSFANVTFNGTGGDWAPQAAMTVDEALTMTAGQLKGTNNVTVAGNAVGTAGTINLTGGTFEQRVAADQNFGPTTASTAWTFSNLTFSTSGATPRTITTQSCSTCGVTVTGVMTVGKTGDTSGAYTTLNAGDKTWTLSGNGTPLVVNLTAGGVAATRSVLTPSTSTFVYTHATSATVAPEVYNNLQTNGAGTYSVGGNISDDFERASLGGNWTARMGTPGISGSSDFVGTAGAENMAIYTASSTNEDQYVEGTISAMSSGNEAWACVRMTGSGNVDGYCYETDGTFGDIVEVINGAWAGALATGTVFPSVGDRIRLEAQGAVLRAYINGQLVMQVTDGATVKATGYPGLATWASGTPTSTFEDFAAGAMLRTTSDISVTQGTLSTGHSTVVVGGGDITVVGTYSQSSNGQTEMTATGSVGGAGTTTFGRLIVGDTGTTLTTTAGGNFTTSVIDVPASSGTNTLDASSRTLTITGSGTPFIVEATEVFTPSTSTIVYTGAAATTISRLTYTNLQVKPGANSITHTLAGGGTLTITGAFEVGNGSNTSVVVDANTNDPTVTVSSAMTINANTTFQASSANGLTVGGNLTNSGTFTHNNGTTTLNGATSTTLNSGCANTDTCTNGYFYNLIINKTDAADANDNVTLTTNGVRVANTLTITDGELIQGALNVRSEGATAVSIASAGKWTNIVDGDLKLGGGFSNAGTAIFNTNNNAQCTDVADDIVITSTSGGTQRLWNGGGTFTIRNVNVTDMTDSAITAYTSTRSNTTWSVGSCGITVSGTIFQTSNESSGYGCNADNLTIYVAVNGDATPDTGTCTAVDGTFSISNVTDPGAADVPIAVYIDTGESVKATTVTLSSAGGANITNLSVMLDRVVVTQQSATALTNSHLNTADNGNAGIRYSVSAGALTVDSGMELHVLSGKTFTPGGAVTTTATGTAAGAAGDLHIAGTLTMGTNSLTVGGDYNNVGTFNKTNTQTTTLAATGTGFTITPGTGAMNNLTVSGDAGGNGTYTLSGADLTVDGALTVNTGDTLTIDTGRILSNTGATNVNNDGTINGAGTLRFTDTSGGPDSDANSTGTYSSVVRYDATAADIPAAVVDARTYGGVVEPYSNSTSARTITANTGTYTLSGSSAHLHPIAANDGDLTFDASANNPTVTIGGDLDFTGTGKGFEVIAAGTGTWTVSGNVDLTNGIYGPTVYNLTPTNADTADFYRLINSNNGCAIEDTYSCVGGSNVRYGKTDDLGNCAIDSVDQNISTDRGWMQYSLASIAGTPTILGAQVGAEVGATYSSAVNVTRSSTDDLASQNCTISSGTYSKIGGSTYGTVSLNAIGNKMIPLGTTGAADIQTRISTTDILSIGLNNSTTEASFGSLNSPPHLYVSIYSSGSPTLTMNGSSKTLTSAGNTLYNLSISGTVTLANETHYVGGDLNLTGGDVTPGTSTVYMVGASKTLTAPAAGDTLANLTIDPASAGTVTLAAGGGDLTVSSLLNVASGDTLSLGANRTLTLSAATGTSLTLTGTISGSGRLTYMTSTAFPSGSTISSTLRFDATNATSQIITSRTYGGPVEIYNNSGGAKTVVSGSGTMAFSSTVDLSVGSGTVTLDLNTTDPTTTTVTGALTIGSGATLSAPSTNGININGNYTNNGTFTDNSGTVTLAGSGLQTLSGTMTGSSDFNNLTVTNSSSTGDPDLDASTPSVTFANAASTAGTFTATTANTKLRFAAGQTYTFVNVTINGGAVGTRVYLRSSTGGTQWNLTSTGTQTISNTNVRDSYACGGDTVDASDGTSFDATKNDCWLINTISMSISDTTIGFGSCSSGGARYATGTTGSASDSADAHTISVSTNARSGYGLTVYGSTLTASVGTISAIGGSATASSVGSEQFGMRAIKNSGTGTVSSPFNTANWAFTAGTTQPVATYSGASSSYSAVYGLRYICNVADVTEAGDYSTDLTYVLTSTF